MPSYALLTKESANRVYADAAPDLLAAELSAVAEHFSFEVANVGVSSLGGVPYVVFDGDELTNTDQFIASNLSGTRALFAKEGDTLRPLDLQPLEWFDDDLISIQRYSGKTNEQFTHLLLNLTIAASTAARDRAARGDQVTLLDPVAGRGSSMNRGLMYGFDVAGVERNDKDVDQYRNFITTYLKDHRVKHKAETERFRKGELSGSSAFDVDIDRGRQSLRMACGDTAKAKQLMSGQNFDVVVGDLPYGVQHVATGKNVRRSPVELVQDSARAWHSVTAKGGAIGLAWNLLTMSRDDLTVALQSAGFTIVEHPRSFEHVVDRAITRDILVATRS